MSRFLEFDPTQHRPGGGFALKRRRDMHYVQTDLPEMEMALELPPVPVATPGEARVQQPAPPADPHRSRRARRAAHRRRALGLRQPAPRPRAGDGGAAQAVLRRLTAP